MNKNQYYLKPNTCRPMTINFLFIPVMLKLKIIQLIESNLNMCVHDCVRIYKLNTLNYKNIKKFGLKLF